MYNRQKESREGAWLCSFRIRRFFFFFFFSGIALLLATSSFFDRALENVRSSSGVERVAGKTSLSFVLWGINWDLTSEETTIHRLVAKRAS